MKKKIAIVLLLLLTLCGCTKRFTIEGTDGDKKTTKSYVSNIICKPEEDDNVKIYVYEYVREDEISLYGFKNLEEREMFLKLIDVKGLGCKMALPMLGLGSVNGLVDAIERENILYLKKFPKIGDKVARQIILDLKGKLVMTKEEKKSNEELEEALKGLGYKTVDINKVIKEVDNSKPIGEQIKDALKLLLKK